MDRLANLVSRHADDWATLAWHVSWQGTVVGLVALAVVSLGRRWPAPVRYWILLLALVKFVTPPLVSSPMGVVSSLVAISDPRSAPESRRDGKVNAEPSIRSADMTTAQAVAVPTAIAASGTREVPAEIVIDRDVDRPGEIHSAPAAARHALVDSTAARLRRLSGALMGIHFTGATLLLAVFILRVLRLQHSWRWMQHPSPELADLVREFARQLGLRRVPSVRLSRETQVPYSAGILHPIVILPAEHALSFSRDDLRAVLYHELAHHRRGDLFINLTQVAIEALWWFHPVVWLVNRAIRSVREECCDDLLLARRYVNDESYCTTLLHVAKTCSRRRFAAPVSVSIADGMHPLAGRILRIMDASLPRHDRPGVLAILALMGVAAVVLPGVHAVTAQSRQPSPAGVAVNDPETVDELREPKFDRTLQKGVAVIGKVTDARGQPIEGAIVALGHYFTNFVFPLTTTTGADGAYRLEHCPEGDSLLTIFKVGLAPHMRTVTVSRGNGEFNVALKPGQTVRIRVTDRNGKPVAGAHVSPFQWPDTSDLTKLHNFSKTDTDGLWTWEWAPENELAYTVRKSGYTTRQPDGALSPGLQLHELTLLPELRVTVKVVDDATDRPVPKFRATLGLMNPQKSRGEQWQAAVAVNSFDGEHTLHQGEIRWEECVAQIEADGYHPGRSRIVRADEENATVVVRLRAAGNREAVVLDIDGTPAAGAAVYLGTETTPIDVLQVAINSSNPGFVARTDGNGRFRFDMQEGEFTIFAMGNSGFAYATRNEISSPSDDPLKILLKPWARVEGTLRKGGKDLPDEPLDLGITHSWPGGKGDEAVVGLAAGYSRHARTDHNGRFVFDRVPSGMVVQVGHLMTVAMPHGPMLGYSPEVYFKTAAGAVRTIALGGFGRTVIGRFQMKDDAWAVDWETSFGLMDPVARPGEVDLRYRPCPMFQIQKDGSFRLDEIPPGKYKIAFYRLVLKPESSLKRKELSGLVVDTVAVPEGAAGEAADAVNIGTLPVGFITGPPPK